MQTVILTDKQGGNRGTAGLAEAHSGTGKLHRAFSVFIFRKGRSEILLQKRASEKRLFPGLWANTCCSHLKPEESLVEAGERRLEEECGIRCSLQQGPSFLYRAEDPQGRGVEYEYDTILIGDADDAIEARPDPSEIEELRWVSVPDLLADMAKHPDCYAFWFRKGLRILLKQQ